MKQMVWLKEMYLHNKIFEETRAAEPRVAVYPNGHLGSPPLSVPRLAVDYKFTKYIVYVSI